MPFPVQDLGQQQNYPESITGLQQQYQQQQVSQQNRYNFNPQQQFVPRPVTYATPVLPASQQQNLAAMQAVRDGRCTSCGCGCMYKGMYKYPKHGMDSDDLKFFIIVGLILYVVYKK
jgi:hypothetical protein